MGHRLKVSVRFDGRAVDHVWIQAASRMGLRVERTKEAYAATDGQGVLLIGRDADLDGDDTVAQLIFHELCHWLVEGPDALEKVDWGLDNTSATDLRRENGALRVQAALAEPYGLRGWFTPTTEHRAYYLRLPSPPTEGADGASRVLARAGLDRVDRPPWGPHLRDALEETRVLLASDL